MTVIEDEPLVGELVIKAECPFKKDSRELSGLSGT